MAISVMFAIVEVDARWNYVKRKSDQEVSSTLCTVQGFIDTDQKLLTFFGEGEGILKICAFLGNKAAPCSMRRQGVAEAAMHWQNRDWEARIHILILQISVSSPEHVLVAVKGPPKQGLCYCCYLAIYLIRNLAFSAEVSRDSPLPSFKLDTTRAGSTVSSPQFMHLKIMLILSLLLCQSWHVQ